MILHQSTNFKALADRIGGIALEHINSGDSVYFQPGDDANTFRDSVEALEEVPEAKRDTIFDMIASNYFE